MRFQLTHLLRGATNIWGWRDPAETVSTHAPLARCDYRDPSTGLQRPGFNSRTSCEVRPCIGGGEFPLTQVSTHAPLARCDTSGRLLARLTQVSTHAPLARCDLEILIFGRIAPFQLTHLLRGATRSERPALQPEQFQLTHLLRGATGKPGGTGSAGSFNSRTSCEVRRGPQSCRGWADEFQLTHLLRGATCAAPVRPTRSACFNSRTSCEVRHRGADAPRRGPLRFNSRTSCEVRPVPPSSSAGSGIVSTHAPLARCDDFVVLHPDGHYVSTHAPLARCDRMADFTVPLTPVSTHAPLARCDRRHQPAICADGFQLTHLLRGATTTFRTCLLCKCFNSRTSCEVRQT